MWKMFKFGLIIGFLFGLSISSFAQMTSESLVPTDMSTTTSTEVPVTSNTQPTETTSQVPSSTTVAPDVTPATGKWNYFDNKQNVTCIMVEAAMQLNLTYVTKSNITKIVLYNIPVEAKDITGQCGNETQNITVKWGEKNFESMFMLGFEKNVTSKHFDLASIIFVLNATVLPDGNGNQKIELMYTGLAFSTPMQMSYHCTRKQTVNMTQSDDTNKKSSQLIISKVMLEAFHTKQDAIFSNAKDCDAIDTQDIVPIAVGCALVALIVIVLIAYLVGRRRSQARGYLSM